MPSSKVNVSTNYSTLLPIDIIHNVFDRAISPLPFWIIYHYFNAVPCQCDRRV